jgi:hypothetical protein
MTNQEIIKRSKDKIITAIQKLEETGYEKLSLDMALAIERLKEAKVRLERLILR